MLHEMADAYRALALTAAKESARLKADTARKISKLYEDAAEDMARMAGRAKSGSLTERWAAAYGRELTERAGEIWRDVYDLTVTGARQEAARAVGIQTSFLTQAGELVGLGMRQTFEGMFAQTPDKAVAAILQGSLYAPNPVTGKRAMLSTRIWNNAAIQSGSIQGIIASAVAGRQTPTQLAKALEQYVNPKAAKPSDWNDLYPGTPFQWNVDYNAKRLAMTSMKHAAWLAEISAAKGNPYAECLHWELSSYHLVTDVCDDYAEHDEGLGLGNWPLDAVPLPHPFCTCIWYVDTPKTLEQVAKELQAWADGGSNPTLDQAFGEWKRENGIALPPQKTPMQLGSIRTDYIEEEFGPLQTDRIIVNPEPMAHVKDHHLQDYDLFLQYIKSAVTMPDYVLVDGKHDGTVFMIGDANGQNISATVRLALETDKIGYLNSVITCHRLREKNLEKLIAKSKVLYKKE